MIAICLSLGKIQAEPLLTADAMSLVVVLQQKGFKVVFEHPSKRKSYGLFVSSSKTLFVSPLAFELGIGQAVLVHEATHAAQSCPNGQLTPIGWKLKASPVVSREISGILVHSYRENQHLEREAFLVQGHHDAIPKVIGALKSRCN